MDTVNVIKTFRYYFSNNLDIQNYLGVNSAEDARKQIVYSDTLVVQKDGLYRYPVIVLRMDEDEALRKNLPTNTVLLDIEIYIPSKMNSFLITLNRIKDKLRYLIRKTAVYNSVTQINDQASTLGIDIKLHDSDWAGAVSYNEKTQGTERLHIIKCTARLILGD